jgi:drug/metabolite transporter (DMT)-like permease
MLSSRPDQALPVTATLLATTAFWSMIWSVADGWMRTTPDWIDSLALPGLLFNADLRTVAMAIVWTGLVSTSLNFYVELTALGRVPPSEASVLLASEPLWAALFAATFMGAQFTQGDAIGGALIVTACAVNALVRPSTFGWVDPPESSGGH